MNRILIAIATIWALSLCWLFSLLFDNTALIQATQYEIRYLRTQQEANDRTIQYLIDEQWDLRERIKQVRREAWR